MSTSAITSESDTYFKQSALYQEFLAEREEILKHKWFLSEKSGHDIGFEKALLDWIVNHRTDWREDRHKNKKISSS
ncbi:MAG: DUF4032 domain-containing protein [Verrucomicrobiota bacterium]